MRKAAVALGTIGLIAACAVPASALAAEQLTATPKLTGKLGGSGVLSVHAQATNTLGGLPAPLTQIVIDVPPGITYNFASAPVCSLAVIQQATGSIPPVCPRGSQIGTGGAQVAAILGSSNLNEGTTLDIYLVSRSPVLGEVWANGTTPIAETLTFPGTFTAAPKPFAQKITVNVPPIHTVPGGPDASVTSLSFTLGGTHTATTTRIVKHGRKSVKQTVRTTVGLFDLPKKCPGGALSYAANATFADASNPSITGKVACP